MMKQSRLFILSILLCLIGSRAFAEDVAVPNADGVTIYYLLDRIKKEVYVAGLEEKDLPNCNGDIIIPDMVTYNGETYIVKSIIGTAFSHCGLKSIVIPNSVTSIGSGAFEGCENLISANVGDGVTTIERSAFYKCPKLTYLYLGKNVTSIVGGIYCDNVQTLTINSYHIGDWFKGNRVSTKGPKELVIGADVKSIADLAFRNLTNLTSVTIGNSVEEIGAGAFASCWGLTSLTIPNSVTTIGAGAFYDCTNLRSVTLGKNLTSLSDNAFEGCNSLTSISIPNSVIEIGNGVFRDCEELTSVIISDGVTSIGEESFKNCKKLTSVTLPGTITTLEKYLFEGCESLSSITIPANVKEIYNRVFYGCPLKEITVYRLTPPSFVETLEIYPFYPFNETTYREAILYVPKESLELYKNSNKWSNFSKIYAIGEDPEKEDDGGGSAEVQTKKTIHVATAGTLSSYISESEKYLIDDLTVTGEINGDDLGFIREMAGKKRKGERRPFFDDTEGQLISLDISGANIVAGGLSMYIYEIDNDFEYTVTRNNEIPPRLFEGCTKLAHISIPNSVNSIGSYAFNGTRWLNNQPDGVVYIGKVLYIYKGDMPANTSISVKEGTIGIACSAFEKCSNLTSITIPNSVTNIGGFNWYPKVDYNDVFLGCNGLTTIISGIQNPFDLGSTFGDVDSSVFSNATLYVPKGTVSAYQSKEGWKNFQKIVEASGGSSEDVRKFESGGITYIINDNGTSVTVTAGYSKYKGSISIPSSVSYNGKNYDVTSIGYCAFGDCTGLTSISIPNSVMFIQYGAFQNCSGLTSITLPNSIQSIAQYAFMGCSSLKTIESEIQNPFVIEANTFGEDTYKTAELIVPQGTKSAYESTAGWSLFANITSPSSSDVVVEDNVVYEIEAGTVAVVHADDVSGDVTIEASVVINGETYDVTIIAEEAFKDCAEMTSVEIPNSITIIGEKAFNGCSGLRVIKIGKGILEIAKKAFANIFTSAGTSGEDDGLHFYCDAELVPATSADAFEGTDIAHSTLHVPDNLVETYKVVTPWNGFGTIVGLTETGIIDVSDDLSDVQIFDMQGNRIDKPRKGLNIIRTNDGKAKKVVMR